MLRGILYLHFFLISVKVCADPVMLMAESWLDVVTGELRSPGVIVVVGDQISAVNPESLPKRAKRIDLTGMTLLPGLFDMHVHIDGDELDGSPPPNTIADAALRAVPNAKKLLLSGFTTVRNMGADGFVDLSVEQAIEAGHIIGPRIIPAGHAITTGGDASEVTTDQGAASGPAEMAKAVRYQLDQGARAIKLYTTSSVFNVGVLGARRFSDEELLAAVETAHRRGVSVAAHAHGTQGIIAAANAGVDSIEHGSLLNEEAILALKKNNTYLVPTLSAWFLKYDYHGVTPETEARVAQIAKTVSAGMREAIKAKVRFAFGTDAGPLPFGRGWEEFVFLTDHGMSEIEAIRTATINAAELVKVEDRGQLKPGLLADIIAVSGNPLDDIKVLKDVRFVMKGGIVYKSP